jgi:hypothetical protein
MFNQLFAEKKNISYEKRAEADKKVALISEALQQSNPQERRQRALEASLEKAQLERQRAEQALEQAKRKALKDRELETKKYLDLQISEKQAKNNLSKVQDNLEAKEINQDVQAYT